MTEEELYEALKRLDGINAAFHATYSENGTHFPVQKAIWSNLKNAAQVRLLTEAPERLSLVPSSDSEGGDLIIRVEPPIRGFHDAKHMPRSVAVSLGLWPSVSGAHDD